MTEKVQAAVRTGPSRTEFREFPMPDIPEDSALLKREVAGSSWRERIAGGRIPSGCGYAGRVVRDGVAFAPAVIRKA